jgi:zinc transport system substrate-binding protein
VQTIIILILAGLTTAFAAGCGGLAGSDASTDRVSVVAAFYPLAYAAEEVGRGRVEVANLTPPGTEPHDLEVSPRDVGLIRGADLVLLLGRDFQPQLEEAAGDDANVVRLLDTPGLDLLPNGDPHVWLDPLRYAAIVERIGRALDNEPGAAELVARLRVLDGEFRRGLGDCERNEIVTSHEAFAYLAERYGLEQVAITGLSPEAEPTPGELRDVVELVRARGVTTIYFETLVSPRIAETVARETEATVAVLNPIEGLTEDEAARGADYFSLMGSNLAALREGLGCR